MNRRRRIYEGKAKILYEGPEPGTLVQHFKDDATAFNNKKHDKIEGKGVLNNRISEYLFVKLGEIGVPTHFIKRLNMREQLIREVEIIPLEVVVRNVAAGSLATRIGVDEGTALPRSIVEFYYKSDKLGDPMVADEISPDCSRLWDVETQNKLDKDRFRRDMGGLVEAYQEVARRLGLHVDNPMRVKTGPVLVRSK